MVFVVLFSLCCLLLQHLKFQFTEGCGSIRTGTIHRWEARNSSQCSGFPFSRLVSWPLMLGKSINETLKLLALQHGRFPASCYKGVVRRSEVALEPLLTLLTFAFGWSFLLSLMLPNLLQGLAGTVLDMEPGFPLPSSCC